MNFQPNNQTVMKKYILSILTSVVVMTVLTGCDKDSEGLTGIVYYPAISLDGAKMLDWQMGVAFAEPGYTSTYKGEDYTSHVQVTTDMNLTDPQPGMYTITYSVASPDGFSASASRSVWVSDPADAINGYYTVSPDSYRLAASGTTVYGAISGTFSVVGKGNGKYLVSDMLGGYYSVRAGYGSDYNCVGDIQVDSDGTISLLNSFVAGWGDSAESLSGTWDAATSTLAWDCAYAGMNFNVTMTKVQ